MDCISGVALGAAASALLASLTRDGSLSSIGLDRRSQRRETELIERSIHRSQPMDDSATSAWAYADMPPSEARRARFDCGLRRPSSSPEVALSKSIPWDRGVSCEEARQFVDTAAAKSKERAAAEVLAALQRGNARFWTGNATRPEKSAFERRALIMKQFPSVAVLGCSDSRVPVEIVFDQGLGDMFVVRVAGNCLDTATTASLDYAVHHLKVKVVLVLGHEGCGAVKAAGLPIELINSESAALSTTLKRIKHGLDENRLQHVHDAKAHDREAVVTNVRRQVEQLSQDEAFLTKIREKEIILVGAFYEISSGIVDFFLEVFEAPAPTHANPRILLPGVSRGVTSRLEVSSPNASPVFELKQKVES